MAELWAWNQRDTTQFDPEESFITSGWTSQSLVATADDTVPGGYTLDFTATGNGIGACIWMIQEEINVQKFDVEMVIENLDVMYCGIAFFGDYDFAGAFHVYTAMEGGAGWNHRVDAGTLVVQGSTPQGAGVRGDQYMATYKIRGDNIPDSEPRWGYQVIGHASATQINGRFSTHTDLPSRPVPSTWDNLKCNRFGIAIGASGGNPVGTMKIRSLKITSVEDIAAIWSDPGADDGPGIISGGALIGDPFSEITRKVLPLPRSTSFRFRDLADAAKQLSETVRDIVHFLKAIPRVVIKTIDVKAGTSVSARIGQVPKGVWIVNVRNHDGTWKHPVGSLPAWEHDGRHGVRILGIEGLTPGEDYRVTLAVLVGGT